MITLYSFGQMFGLPDPSPFVIKADLLLKMSGLPYQVRSGDLRRAPKGKLPYIEDEGVLIGDSTLIRLHLEQRHGARFDAALDERERGIAWSVEKMLEDHLYWAVVHARWVDDVNFDKGPRRFFDPVPALIRPLIVAMVRRKVRRNLHGHGLGRHSEAEIVALASRSIDAIAGVLGDRPYLMGAAPCGADATLAAFLISVLAAHFDTALRRHTEQHANLVDYRNRLLRTHYPDLR